MTRSVLVVPGLFMLALFTAAPVAGDDKASLQRGGELAKSRCDSCHGPAMVARAPLFPGLDGQKQAYLYKQLLDFKLGHRKDPVMQAQATNMSDEQLRDVALYYSRQAPLDPKALIITD